MTILCFTCIEITLSIGHGFVELVERVVPHPQHYYFTKKECFAAQKQLSKINSQSSRQPFRHSHKKQRIQHHAQQRTSTYSHCVHTIHVQFLLHTALHYSPQLKPVNPCSRGSAKKPPINQGILNSINDTGGNNLAPN